jgi:transposase
VDSRILKLKILIIDGTPCKSKSRKPKEKGTKATKSDPEARFGYQKWGRECFFGYKSMILASSEPLIVPLSWQVIPANQQEVNHLISVVSQAGWLLKRDKHYELIGDSGFDAGYNYDWCQQLNIRLTCPLNMANKLKGERLRRWEFYKSKLGQKLYQRRTDIERLNGHLKDLFLIDPFPVKRLKNVNTYLNLAMLCYLACVYYNFTNKRNLREIKSLIA